MTLIEYMLAVFGGFFAGVINTLAGSGSVITLGFMTEFLGMPANIANGTNRIGIFTQSLASTAAFKQNNKLPLDRSKFIIVLTILGAIIGVLVAVKIPNSSFKVVYKGLMVMMLALILIRPERWLQESDVNKKISLWLLIPVFLTLGFYGGFIQMGMGVFFLAVMVLLARYNLVESNAVKTVVVTIYTFIVLLIFHFQGMVDWKVGGIIALGQASGGWLTAQVASKSDKANLWAYRLLVVVVVLVVLKTFGVFSWLMS